MGMSEESDQELDFVTSFVRIVCTEVENRHEYGFAGSSVADLCFLFLRGGGACLSISHESILEKLRHLFRATQSNSIILDDMNGSLYFCVKYSSLYSLAISNYNSLKVSVSHVEDVR